MKKQLPIRQKGINLDLIDILKRRKCFKLVCGAGNEDTAEVEKLVALYAKAGVHYFDLSAKREIVSAAKKGLERVIPRNEHKKYFLNVSFGIAGDPHIRKAYISKDKCQDCGICKDACLQKAIEKRVDKYYILEKRCIGCGLCEKECPSAAITFIDREKDLNEVLPPLIGLGIDSVELHAVTDDGDGAFSKWNTINKLFGGVLSLCLDRSHLGDIRLIERIKKFISNRKDFSTVIQADGAPMSGVNDSYATTLQAIATADIVQKAKLPVWLLLSGGTNSKTTEMASLFGIKAHGVTIGSFARMLVKDYIVKDDFLKNEKIFNKAYIIAKQLVDKSLKYLG